MSKSLNKDLKDSEKDEKKLQPDNATLDLPDVKDIPGQENIHVPNLQEMADTTISSDDEEGVGIWNDDEKSDDLSSERLGAASSINENDLIIDENVLETKLDEQDEFNESDDLITDDDSNVLPDEKIALERTEDVDTQDNEDLYRAGLDDTDFDGEKLNETIDVSGEDLDVPGEEDDDANEAIGEEDEENNEYSLGDNE